MKSEKKLNLNEELTKIKNLIYSKNSSITEGGWVGDLAGGAAGATGAWLGMNIGTGIMPGIGTVIGGLVGAAIAPIVQDWFTSDNGDLALDANKKYEIAMDPGIYDGFKDQKMKKQLSGLNIISDKDAMQYAKTLNSAIDGGMLFGLGTDEDAIMGVFGKVSCIIDISGIAKYYKDLFNESLKDALEGDLNGSEMNNLKNLIAKDPFIIYNGKRIETKEDLEKAIGGQSAPQNQNAPVPTADKAAADKAAADNSGTSKSIQWINAPTLDDVINGKNIFIKRGMKGESVGQVQKAVVADIDNKFGRETEYKVMGFQTANKMLKADGIVDKETAQLIVSKLGKIGGTQQNIAPMRQQPTAPIDQSTSQQAAAQQINQPAPTEFSSNIAKFFVRNNGKKVIAKSKKEGGFTTDDIASIQKYIMDTYGVKYVLDRYIDKPTKDKLVFVAVK